MCILLVAIIIALEATLQKSKKEAGLQDVADAEDSAHYAWTAIPALILGFLAMAFSSSDSTIRSLVPYMMLGRAVCKDELPNLSLLDASVPRFLYREMKLPNVGVVSTTTAFLLASTFTTFSGSLFQVLPTPLTDFVIPQTQSSFNWTIHEDENASMISTLIFEGNYSYPRFTYDNMAFPALANTTAFPFQSPTASVSAVIPAMRARLDCRLYDSAKIRMDPDHHQEPNAHNNAYQNPLDLRVEAEDCKYPDVTPDRQRQHRIPSMSENATYFGSVSVFGCSDVVYIWGSVDGARQPTMNHSAALGCNATYEVVDAEATFAGADLAFDPQNPPRPLEAPARRRPVRASPRSILWYCFLASMDTAPLDNLFALFVSSPWAVARADLGDPAADRRVAGAIRHHHGIIVAQHVSAQRVPANETDAGRRYNATATDPAADEDRRVYGDGDEAGPRRFGIFALEEAEDNGMAAESAGSGGSVVAVLCSGYRGVVAED